MRKTALTLVMVLVLAAAGAAEAQPRRISLSIPLTGIVGDGRYCLRAESADIERTDFLPDVTIYVRNRCREAITVSGVWVDGSAFAFIEYTLQNAALRTVGSSTTMNRFRVPGLARGSSRPDLASLQRGVSWRDVRRVRIAELHVDCIGSTSTCFPPEPVSALPLLTWAFDALERALGID